MAEFCASCDVQAMDCPACHQPNIDGARFCAKCGALLPMPSVDAQDSLIGQIVGGRYRIKQLLGEGGMGRVYLAEQQMGTNVRKVAVKTLQAQFAQDPHVLARFHRECGTVSELEHPNTIQFFDFGQTPDGQLYIAMEFVQGESLSDALKPGPMRPERVLRILAQVCGSLEEAHGRGVVHRDLKPDNIILTTRAGQADFVKVLDFGIAKRSEAKDQAQEQKLTQQGMVLGTPPYMSPEQFTGKELDNRSDIYSLAVMAYEMLTGRLPFEAETPWQWATAHMTAQPSPFESIPASAGVPLAMRQGILRALSKDREHRQSTVRQFYEEIAGGGAAVGTVSPPVAAVHPGRGTEAMAPMTPAGPSNPGFTPPPGPSNPGFTPHPVAHLTPYGGQTFPTSPQPIAARPPAKSGGKGLIMGLVAVGAVLAVVAVILVVRQMRPDSETAIAPTPPPATAVANAPLTQERAAAEPPAEVEPGKPAAPAAPRKAPVVAPTPPAPPPAPTLTGEAACAEAKRLADNGDTGGAMHAFAGCSGPGAASAKGAIARSAPAAVQRRIFNGDCAGARALVAGLSAMGGAGGAEAVIDRAPQCKK